MSERLARLGRRVTRDPFFLGEALAVYAESARLDEAGLCALLGCAGETLTQLRLCRRPVEATFRSDVAQIAARFGVDAGQLAQIVRQADSIAALRGAERRQQTLLAARDRDDEPEGER